MGEPKIKIVDENDNVIGAKARNEIDYSKDIYQSTGLWVENSKGETLIAQRKFTKDKDPGKWGPAVAGTVDEGETYETNIYKEAEEEIGLTGVKFDFILKNYDDTPRNNHFTKWYKAVVDKPLGYFTPQESEVEKLVWIKKEELLEDIKNNPDKYVSAVVKVIERLV